jgi:TRAP-type C4-dicarboxylate transport system permease small subunit
MKPGRGGFRSAQANLMEETMIGRLEKIASTLGAVLMFSIMMLTFLDVSGRNIFNHPIPGAIEVTELMLGGTIFFMLPKAAYHNKHIVIDLIDMVTNAKGVAVLNTMSAVVSAGFFLLISWQLWIMGQRALDYADATPSLDIPVAPFIFGLAVLAAVNAAAHLLATPGYFKAPEPASPAEQVSFTV